MAKKAIVEHAMTKKIRIIILGTGGMAKAHALAFKDDPRCDVVAAVDVMPGRAKEFAATFGIAHHFEDLDKAISWGRHQCDAGCHPLSHDNETAGRKEARALRKAAGGKFQAC
jgi:shikimate 5-dehydrogenase